MTANLFPIRDSYSPKIYAYTENNPNYYGYIKIGYTTKNVEDRVAQQFPILKPEEKPYTIIFSETAMREDGTSFTDKDIHRYLRKKGFENPNGEWFKCSLEDLKNAYISILERKEIEQQRIFNFTLREEQQDAIFKTINYFNKFNSDPLNKGKIPHFLWNAKMRFGKTFTSYKLAQQMGWTKILVLTFKPAVENAWREDLMTHIDFEGWQFISRDGLHYEDADKTKPFVCFGSFQDYLGKSPAGGIKPKNEWVHKQVWDCVILDEYHYGAWRERAKELFESESEKEQDYGEGEGIEYFDESIMPIKTSAYLYLSGTPFRAIASGEFIEDQIYNWTYSDEQRKKYSWVGEDNPYISLPKMVLMTYQLPESLTEITSKGEFNEFDLNTFFEAKGEKEQAKFTYENEVQKWLDLIRGSYNEFSTDNLKLGGKKPPMPFSDTRLLSNLLHTFWFLPSVASCYAMKNLLMQRQNIFYHDYNIIVCAGPSAGIGEQAIFPVRNAMREPLNSKTITLSCGKLTTGITIRPWSGIFMLRNLTSPETYFQSAFRIQSPWTLKSEDIHENNKVLKEVCYIFDFAPNRALRQISDYSCRLNVSESDPEKKVKEFIDFLPVLAFDGSSMKQIDANGILDIATSGTTATLLARRWESALLVNVDDLTLSRLLNNKTALEALMNIEGFRNLNKDLELIINKSESIKEKKKRDAEKGLSTKEKQELSDEEREYKSMRKKIQEKLIKFATRIPIFMYLTDYRERTLKDIITQLEPELFQKVSGLTIKDFELLVSLGVFNGEIMNDAVYKFKRYEDASLEYTGINKHTESTIGLFDTTITKEEFYNQE